jgi:uncharacterized protein (DUF488 family)
MFMNRKSPASLSHPKREFVCAMRPCLDSDLALLTLGHGTASADELGALIRDAGIRRLVDVRKLPGSRRHPQFAREELERWVPQLTGASYRWMPQLGGFRKPDPRSEHIALRNASFRAYADYMETGEFVAALDELLSITAAERAAIMCSETVWWLCHRRLISDAAQLLRGVAVGHLMHDGIVRPHVPTAGVRATAAGILRYDLAENVGLPLDS